MKAILIEKIRISLSKANLTLAQLFAKYDKNKDGILEQNEFTKALADCHLVLGQNMLNFLVGEAFDPQSVKQRRSGRIAHGMLKVYLEAFGGIGSK